MTGSGPAVTVLVVDDDAGVRQVTRLLLERAGYAVMEAADGREAVGAVRERGGTIDVVLLDVMMPEMTGHEALPQMRALRPGLPVIFSSGYAVSEVADHLVRPSAYTSFLPKPSSIEVLTAEIERAMAGSGVE